MSTRLTPSHSGLAPHWTATALAILLMLVAAPICSAEQPTATPVATDRPALAVSNQFSVPNQFRLTDGGDVYFTSGSTTALFRWSQATGARQRLLQTNDPLEKLRIPGLPQEYADSPLDATGSLLQVNAGYAAFLVSTAIKGERDPTGVIVYDGASYRLVDNVGLDTFSRLFVNASGRVAISGNAGALGTTPARIYVETATGALKLAEQFQPAPASVGGNYNTLQLIGFNNAGRVAFLAEIQGGSTTRAVFLAKPPYQAADINLVVKSGDSASGSGTFNLRSAVGNYLLNNAGEVAFATDVAGGTNGIWIGRPPGGGSPTKLLRLNDPTGTDLLGSFSSPFALRGFNDAGQVLFSSNVSGGSHALFLRDLSPPSTQVVFSKGQAAPSGGSYDTTQQASLNSGGNVAFLATLTGGSSPIGLYLFSGSTNPLIRIAAQGDATPLGGLYGLAGKNTPALLNDGSQVLFIADILERNAVGLFTWTSGGGARAVVSTRDTLPTGAATVLRAGPPASSDTEILLRVLKAGGQASWYAKPLETGMIGLRKIVAEFDQVIDAGTVVGPGSFSMNGKGELVFLTTLLGAGVYPCIGMLASLPASGLERVVLLGDGAPGGGTINSLGSPQLNNQSQVALWANTTAGDGIFLATKDPPSFQAVARAAITSWPDGGGTFNSFGSGVLLNDSSQVAFLGNGPGGVPGLFVETGGTIVRVVKKGDTAPGGGVVDNVPVSTFKLNAAGQVAYQAGLVGGSSGIFLASATSGVYAPQKVARTADPAPSTGGATFAFFREESIDLNNSGKVAFWAGLCCSQIGSGWFLGSAVGAPSPRLLQNQQLPGGGKASQASPGFRIVALANSGEIAIYVADTYGTDFQPQIVIAGVDGTLRRFAENGAKAQGTGGDFGKLFPQVWATPSGKFLFGAMLLNGPAKAGVFTNKP